jgi:Ca2+-transporting ATPase
LATDPALFGTIGIEDLRDSVREACVRVTVCTGDIALTAGSISQECGIYTPDGIIMEGSHFLSLPPDLSKSIAPRLQVPARSSSEDKQLLVEALKERGDFVGVTGDGTKDGSALKTGHVGFFMDITAGKRIAKKASDTILMDVNFLSIVKAIMRGQCVNDTVRKFYRFQISTNLTAVVITFITALASSEEEEPLNAAQLFWLNIINTFATLAVATNPALPVLLNREPDKKTDPSFTVDVLTVDVLKQSAGQSTYQNAIVLIFKFFGSRFFGFHHMDEPSPQKHNNAIVQTLVFNAFAFAQIFDPFDSRRLDRKLNIFEGTSKNWYFMATTFVGSSFLLDLHSV